MKLSYKATIAIPTYNRSTLLEEILPLALGQKFNEPYEVLIIDNASTDETQIVVKSFQDSRIRYIKNPQNIGMLNNWNKAIAEAKGQYLMILGDDDWLYPEFLSKSTAILDKYPNVGFSFSHCNKVDNSRNLINRWGYKFTPAGIVKGEEYLFYTLDNECCLTNSSTVLIRKSALDSVGKFIAAFGKNTFDFNMWIRIANKFDVFFIDEVLSDYRIHENQISETHWRDNQHPTGKIGTYLELIQVAALLNNRQSLESKYSKEYIHQKLVKIGTELATLIGKILPNL